MAALLEVQDLVTKFDTGRQRERRERHQFTLDEDGRWALSARAAANA